MKPSLQLNLTNQLNLTPQLKQAIRFLQLSTLDLQHEIKTLLESNPLLESQELSESTKEFEEHADHEEEFDFQWASLYRQPAENHQFNENPYIFENLHCTKTSLQDHLRWQIGLSPMSDVDRVIAIAIIDAIDENGFLTQAIEDFTSFLSSKKTPIDKQDLMAVLHRIQLLEPIGCGAQNLQETLLIQLNQFAPSTPYLELAKHIILNSFEHLTQPSQLQKQYHISEKDFQGVMDLVHKLNPKPGSAMTQNTSDYLIPDLLVRKSHDAWQVCINPVALPKLNINDHYAAMIQRTDNSVENQFLKNNLNEARWLIKSIKNRQDTLLKVAQYLIEYQQDFFEHGPGAMKPLTLSDVASALNIHESTVSRATTQKYISTPNGLHELRYFFSSHVTTQAGEACSAIAICELIKKLIANENTQKPLSDNALTKLIKAQGIEIARRTVTKYREEMKIASSFERKSIRSSY